MKKILPAILLFALAGCSPSEQDFVPVPEKSAALNTESFTTADDVTLPMRSWLPAGKPRAVIVAVHGFNDYSNAFEGTGQFFKKRSIAVYAYDQRGFGKAPGRGLWGNEENYTGDLKQYVSLLKTSYPRTPIYVLGESMGGAIAIAALSQPDFPQVNGLVLVSPAVWGDGTLNPLYRSTLWLAAHTMPDHEVTGSDLHILATNNIPLLRKMVADPLIIKSTRIDAIYGMVGVMDTAYEKTPDVKTPVLMLYGGHDQVIPPEPIEEARRRITSPIVYAYYPNGYHMLLRDLQGETVLRDVYSWVEHPRRPLPSGFSRSEAAQAN